MTQDVGSPSSRGSALVRIAGAILVTLGGVSLVLALTFAGAAIYATLTIPDGEVNESASGFMVAFVCGFLAAVLLGFGRRLHRTGRNEAARRMSA